MDRKTRYDRTAKGRARHARYNASRKGHARRTRALQADRTARNDQDAAQIAVLEQRQKELIAWLSAPR